jgi:hypothetical protein
VAFYSDKHSIFRVNTKDAIGGDGVTQFGRALAVLNIDILCANTPQAKGRVERAFGTLQDRLVKELRLAGISTMEAANAWLPGFIANYNARFGREPANAKNLHRPLTAADDLDEILAWRETRTVTKNLTLHYDRMMLLLEPTPFVRGLVRKTVEVVNYPDGRFAVQFAGVSLPFRVFDEIQTVQPGTIVENKRLGAALTLVKQMQDSYPPHRQRHHPTRRRPRRVVQAVCRTTLAPLADGLGGDAIALGEDAGALVGAGDLGTGDGRGAGVQMDLQHRSELPLAGLDQTVE